MTKLAKMLQGASRRHDTWQVFSDFLATSALAISNSCDLTQRDTREAEYMGIIGRYEPKEVEQFPVMFGELIEALEASPTDVLGKVFHELELHNKWLGQFFTPYDVCRMMAEITAGDPASIVERNGFIAAHEPAVGSGAMVIALANAIREAGVNPQQSLFIDAIDLDIKCVHMAYLQFSLLGLPARVTHGNSLSLEMRSTWFTPAYILGGWGFKLRRRWQEPTGEPTEIEIPRGQLELFDTAA